MAPRRWHSVVSGEARVVLVTGGSRGIGAACVTWFLNNGDNVAFTYRGDVAPTVTNPETCFPVSCDVTVPRAGRGRLSRH